MQANYKKYTRKNEGGLLREQDGPQATCKSQ